MNTIEHLQKEIARAYVEGDNTHTDAVGLTAAQAEKLLAVAKAAQEEININSQTRRIQYPKLCKALAALEKE